jgi:lysophospholipase L1-like esterase
MRLLSLLLAACFLAAADGPRTTVPAEKDPGRHQQFLAVAKAGGVDLLFLGDSITDGWRNSGKAVWDQFFAPLKAANFGISGDRTEHVIWRLRNGELEGIHPKLAVVMIGTNNGGDSAEDVALGIKTIIGDVQSRSPGTRILLLGIFPRGEKPEGARLKNEKVNQIIAGYATPNDPRRVVYLDIGDKFLTPDRILGKDIMPDALHPNAKGYQIWADAIIEPVKRLLADDPGHLAPTFSKRSEVPKVAKLEESIMAGGLAAGAKALEKLSSDKDAATAEAAKASLEQLAAWKASVEAGIAKQRDDGDVYGACEMVAALAKLYTGEASKPYKEQEAALRKDPGYAAGKEFQKLADVPMEARRGPRFAKQVEAFLKKHPDGFYAEEARKLAAP